MSKKMIIGMPFDYEADQWELESQQDKARMLLNSSIIPDEHYQTWRSRIDNDDLDSIEATIAYLYNNQADPIQHGKNYQQGDILKKLKNERRD